MGDNACCTPALALALHANATQTMQMREVHQMKDSWDIYLATLATGTVSGETGTVGMYVKVNLKETN